MIEDCVNGELDYRNQNKLNEGNYTGLDDEEI